MRQTAYVRYKPDAEDLTISLVLGGRHRNLNRPIDEPLEKPFTRIRANMVPAKQDKRNKKKKLNPEEGAAAQQQQQQEQELFVGLFKDSAGTELIDASTPNGQAWPQAALLRVGSQDFDVLLNPPTVETLTLPGFPMAGYPVLPVVGLAFAEPQLCKWRWLRKQQASGKGASGSKDKAAAAAADWEETGCDSMCYTPSERDIGYMLRVEFTPGAAAAAAAAGDGNGAFGEQQQQVDGVSAPSTAPPAAAAAAVQQQQGSKPTPATAVTVTKNNPCTSVIYGEPVTADTGPVKSGPEQPAARLRQLSPGVALAEPWRFRIMSYNILADQYAGTSYAKDVLFKYCPTDLLDNNYRRQLVLEEILRYQPDICCLQEVDDKVFSEFLAPHLARSGFCGHYTNKQGRVREGSAMFWRQHKWACAAVQDVKLRDVFKLPLSDRHSQFTAMLESSPALAEALQKVTTVAQMVLLLPRTTAATAGTVDSPAAAAAAAAAGVAHGDPAPLLVINTHLFFHPYAPHIRSLHTAAILEEAAAALADWQQQAQQQQGPAAAAAAVHSSNGSSSSGSGVIEPQLLSALAVLPPPTVLFCGDLNSDLNSSVPGVVEMLQTGRLAADHWDWQMGATFRWGKEEEEYAEEEQQQQQQQQSSDNQQQQQSDGPPLPLADGHDFEQASSSPRASVALHGVDVQVPFVLRSADDLATPYTNYTSGYKALLDYAWYDPTRLDVTKQLPVPAEQLLASFIPSPNFPSDHLAVVYDLAFKPRTSSGSTAAAAAAAASGETEQQQHHAAGVELPIQRHDSATFTLLPATEDHVSDAVAALQRGEVIALPTDTLYGLAAAAGSGTAVQQLRAIKQRSLHAPFAVAVADVDDVAKYCLTDQLPPGLLRAVLPGPVTVLLPLKPDADLADGVLNPDPSSSSSTSGCSGEAAAAAAVAGVRVVPNEFVRHVCRQLGGGIALTSANISGGESTTCIHDFRDLWQYCGAVFDSGRIPVTGNQGSTVIDLSSVGQQPQLQQQLQGEQELTATAGFRIVRAGVAAESVVELLTKAFGLQQLQ